MGHEAMSSTNDIIHAVAAEWHATSERDDFDWEGFTAWLEADPRHARAFDEIALADALVADHAATLASDGEGESPSGNVIAIRPRGSLRWPLWASGAVAAALVAFVAVPRFIEPPPQVYTTAAQTRTLALADGSRIVLAPQSRLEIGGRQQQRMTLAGGAWFEVRHDPARQLAIVVGDETISDVGTTFDVQETRDSLRVSVAEGALSVVSETLDRPVQLPAGRALVLDRRNKTAEVRETGGDATGAWRDGRLTYNQVPLRLVVVDLARYARLKVVADKAVADRRFSGTLMIGHGDDAARDLSQLMGLALDAGPDGYRLYAPTR